MKTLLALLLFIPSLSWGDVIELKCTPKEYKMFDGIAKAKKCTNKIFSELLNDLGYSCDSIADYDNQVIKPTFIQYKD